MNAILLPKRAYQPYEALTGEVRWDLEKSPKGLELRLLWTASGASSDETQVIGAIPLGREKAGSQAFAFELPGAPWSVAGHLISVTWTLELAAKKQPGLAVEEIVLSRSGEVVELRPVNDRLARRQSRMLDRFRGRKA